MPDDVLVRIWLSNRGTRACTYVRYSAYVELCSPVCTIGLSSRQLKTPEKWILLVVSFSGQAVSLVSVVLLSNIRRKSRSGGKRQTSACSPSNMTPSFSNYLQKHQPRHQHGAYLINMN